MLPQRVKNMKRKRKASYHARGFPLDSLLTDYSYERVYSPHKPGSLRSKRGGRKVQPMQREFIWETDDGERLRVSRMATPHLFNAARMIYNHTVPPVLRVGKFIRRLEVHEWDSAYKAQAYRALLRELKTRGDLESKFKAELDDMEYNRWFVFGLGYSIFQ